MIKSHDTNHHHHHRYHQDSRMDNVGGGSSSSSSSRHPPPPTQQPHRTPQELYRPPRSRPNADVPPSALVQQPNHRHSSHHHHQQQPPPPPPPTRKNHRRPNRFAGAGPPPSHQRYQRRYDHHYDHGGSKYNKNLARFDQMQKYPKDAVVLIVNKYNLSINLGGTATKSATIKIESQPGRKSASISLSELILVRSITELMAATTTKEATRKKPVAGMIMIKATAGTSKSSPPPEGTTKTSAHKYGGLIRLNRESMELLQHPPNHHHAMTSVQSDHHRRSDFHRWEDLLDEIRYHTYRKRGGVRRVHIDPGIAALRGRVMAACEQLLLSDLNRSTTHNVLPNCWDTCFYDFIRMYRVEEQPKQQQQHNSNENNKQTEDSSLLATLTKEGLDYFSSLYHKLLSRYNFPTMKILYERNKYYKINPSLYSHLHDVTYVVKIIFIYLGDLWRYIEYGHHQNHFKNSKNYYMKAHMLVPKNSHVLSQLALVSFYQRNYFDAIYYYLVSLEYEIIHDRSSVKFLTKHLRVLSSRQNLVVFFDSVRSLHLKHRAAVQREYDAAMEQNNRKRQRNERGHCRINKYHRIEYWVRPNQTVAKCDMYNFYDLAAVNSNEDDPGLLKFYQDNVVKNLSFKDLKDRFVTSFLMVHGMLSYRTGLDRFFDVANQMVLEFDQLLAQSFSNQNQSAQQPRISSLFLIQLLVINMYSVMNTFNTYDDRNHCDYQNSACYGFTHRNAYFIMSIMMSTILKRLISIFDAFRWKNADFLAEPDKYNKKKPPLLEKEPESVEDFFGSVHNTERIAESSSSSSQPQGSQNGDQQKINDWIEFYTLLPCVKLWSDWIISYNPYFPPNDMNDIKTNHDHQNIWQIFAEFLTLLHQIKQYPVSFYVDEKSKTQLSLLSPPKTNETKAKEEYELVQLPEDRCLDGFKILRDVPESSKYVKLPFVAEIAYIYMRIESIKLFGDYLCGLRYPYLKFDLKTGRFDSLIHGDDVENQPGMKLKQVQQQQFQEAIARFKKYYGGVDTAAVTEDDGYSDDEEAIREIDNLQLCPSERRKLLQYRMLRQQNAIHGRYFKMLEHITEPKRRIIIRPRYVVFDTNCFINDLATIMAFVRQPAPFTVTVPLIVIQELQYMQSRDASNGADNNANQQRLMNLSGKAREILNFLEEAFERNRYPNIKAITSKGSLLDDIAYKEELSYNPDVYNNDDLVLYACENLIKEQPSQTWPSNQSLQRLLEESGERNLSDQDEFVFRDVVLVTDDMNLRIKSLGYDIPVKKFKQFRKWTNTLATKPPSQPHR